MKKWQSYCVVSLMALFVLSGCNAEEKKPNVQAEEAKEKALRETTKGDQTDIYAIPFDEDQQSQQEELDKFEKESKQYEETHPKASS